MKRRSWRHWVCPHWRAGSAGCVCGELAAAGRRRARPAGLSSMLGGGKTWTVELAAKVRAEKSLHSKRASSHPRLADSTSWTSVYLSPPAHAPVCCGGVAAGEALRSWLLFLSLRVAIVSGR